VPKSIVLETKEPGEVTVEVTTTVLAVVPSEPVCVFVPVPLLDVVAAAVAFVS
jgi:hypothetical protein